MIIVGIGGPSCSGKSTFSRHLRMLIPHAAILYEDDFYLPENELPLDSKGLPNWDCPQSFDLKSMREQIIRLKQENEQPDQETREDRNNNNGQYLLTQQEIDRMLELIADFSEPVLLVDGILLYHKGSEIADLLDFKVTFPFSYSDLKARREARTGYETNDGFWKDPPGYFEDLIWPEFKKYNGYLYVEDPEKKRFGLSDEAKAQNLWMPSSTAINVSIEEFLIELKKLRGC